MLNCKANVIPRLSGWGKCQLLRAKAIGEQPGSNKAEVGQPRARGTEHPHLTGLANTAPKVRLSLNVTARTVTAFGDRNVRPQPPTHMRAFSLPLNAANGVCPVD